MAGKSEGEVVVLDFALDGAAGDAEAFGCEGAVALGLVEDVFEGALFDFVKG